MDEPARALHERAGWRTTITRNHYINYVPLLAYHHPGRINRQIEYPGQNARFIAGSWQVWGYTV